MYAPLTTVGSAKAWLKNTSTGDDAQFLKIIARCSELIGRHLGRSNLAEVLPYNETRFIKNGGGALNDSAWTLVLRAWPLVTLQSVSVAGGTVPILTAAQAQSGAYGVYVDTEENGEARTLKMLGAQLRSPGMLIISYTAGYNGLSAVPLGLQQACDQYVGEVLRSASNLMLKSASLAGETTTYDMGDLNWGMSNRTLSMLQPYKDVLGWALT